LGAFSDKQKLGCGQSPIGCTGARVRNPVMKAAILLRSIRDRRIAIKSGSSMRAAGSNGFPIGSLLH